MTQAYFNKHNRSAKVMKKLNSSLHEFLISLPPPVGKGILAGDLVIQVGAGDEVVPFIAFAVFTADGHFHPPAFAFMALVKNYFVLKIFHCNGILDEIVFLIRGEIAFTAVEPVDKVPDHLRGELGSNPLPVEPGVSFIDADGGQLIAQACITYDLADLFPVKAVGGGIGVAGRVGGPDGPHIHGDHIGIPYHRLYFLHIGPYHPETVGVEIEVFHKVDGLLVDKVGLEADIGEIEEEIGLLQDDMAHVRAGSQLIARGPDVELRVDPGDIDDPAELFVSLVLGKGQVLAAPEDYRDDMPVKKVCHDAGQGKISVVDGMSDGYVSQVNHIQVEIPLEQLVEFFPDRIRGQCAAGVEKAVPLFPDAKDCYIGMIQRWKIARLQVGGHHIAHQFTTGLIGIIISLKLDRLEID
jgi:hypothetical protein